MSSMPTAAGMDIPQEGHPTGDSPFAIPEGARSTSGDTNMRADVITGPDGRDMADWDQDANGNGAAGYPMEADIGTQVPNGLDGAGGAANASTSGTPATASGYGGGPSNMNPQPYE